MQTREIPAEQWEKYLDEFNRTHVGQSVRMETRPVGGEGSVACDHVPLLGIVASRADAEGALSMEVTVGHLSERRQHAISDPVRIWVAESDGIETAIQIENRDGAITLLHLSMQPSELISHEMPLGDMPAIG